MSGGIARGAPSAPEAICVASLECTLLQRKLHHNSVSVQVWPPAAAIGISSVRAAAIGMTMMIPCFFLTGQCAVKRCRRPRSHGSPSRRLKSAAAGRQTVRPNLHPSPVTITLPTLCRRPDSHGSRSHGLKSAASASQAVCACIYVMVLLLLLC